MTTTLDFSGILRDSQSTPLPKPDLAVLSDAKRIEAVSPFVAWNAVDRGEIPEIEDSKRPLLIDLLRDPVSTVDRLLDPEQLGRTVLGAMVTVIATTSFFGAVVMSALTYGNPLPAAAVLPINLLIAMAAALGPMYATGLLVAARLPMARLVAVVLTATATGSAVMAGLAPIPYALYKADEHWLGPIALFACCGLAAIAGGARLHVMMYYLASEVRRRMGGELSQSESFRVGILARMSMVILAFTMALTGWVLDVFV
ncbi:MAG: hypothetical protein HY791_39010 [Deltaproteobacteria bacterium]|nr:hypothetical protein [Deltaproteobacteria bacterium]